MSDAPRISTQVIGLAITVLLAVFGGAVAYGSVIQRVAQLEKDADRLTLVSGQLQQVQTSLAVVTNELTYIKQGQANVINRLDRMENRTHP